MKISAEEKKYLKYGVGILGVLLIYKYFISNKIDNTGVLIDPTGNGNNASNGGLAPIFNPKSVADDLWIAMKDMGTDENAIFETLKYVNQAQFNQVIQAFGKRAYNKTTGNNLTVWGFSLNKYDLKSWLRFELSDQNYNTLRTKYSGQL
jgi:hypothetical protein